MVRAIKTFIRREILLCVALVCAVATTLLVPFDAAAIAQSVDVQVLVLLFCLMASVCEMQRSGVFSACINWLLERVGSVRQLVLVLVMLPFFTSMLVTNDVSLIAFVPFALIALREAGQEKLIARTVVLQVIAANLGGMATQIGNPQNIFIYTRYGIPFFEFLAALLPFVVLAFALLAAVCLLAGRAPVSVSTAEVARVSKKRLAFAGALLFLCLLCILRVIPHWLLMPIVVALLLAFGRSTFAGIDYALLVTFLCFFVFSGNMARIPFMVDVLGALMDVHPMMASLLASQAMSNVPAAVLLSGFTDNWHSLLLGVDLGGLGTPIASLASLIGLRLYLASPGASGALFMREFSLANAGMLAAMLALYFVLFVV